MNDENSQSSKQSDVDFIKTNVASVKYNARRSQSGKRAEKKTSFSLPPNAENRNPRKIARTPTPFVKSQRSETPTSSLRRTDLVEIESISEESSPNSSGRSINETIPPNILKQSNQELQTSPELFTPNKDKVDTASVSVQTPRQPLPDNSAEDPEFSQQAQEAALQKFLSQEPGAAPTSDDVIRETFTPSIMPIEDEAHAQKEKNPDRDNP